jgi:hypothetical protein
MSERAETEYSYANCAKCQLRVWTQSKSYSRFSLLSPDLNLPHSVQKEVKPLEEDLTLGR